MSPTPSHETQSEAVAVFDDAGTLEQTVDELLRSGFDRSEISLLASEQAVEAKLGHAYEKVAALEDDPSVPRAAYVSTEAIGDAEGGLVGGLAYVGALAAVGAIVASGGTLAAAIGGAAAAGGAGGVLGSVLAKLVGDQHANALQEQLRHGGLLLWVRTRDEDHEGRAIEILGRHSGHDIHIHPLRAMGAA